MKLPAVFATLLVTVITVVPALWAGHTLNRWRSTTDLEVAAARLVKFPTEFGSWRVITEGEPLTEAVKRELGVSSYVSRRYENSENGAKVTMLLMVGQPGPLLRHPPNICYANRANRQVGAISTFSAEATTPSSEFTVIQYEPPSAVAGDRFAVAYAMTTGITWSVPRFPRLEYGAASKLYKVQFLAPLEQGEGFEMLKKFAAEFTAQFAHLESGGPPTTKRSDGGPTS